MTQCMVVSSAWVSECECLPKLTYVWSFTAVYHVHAYVCMYVGGGLRIRCTYVCTFYMYAAYLAHVNCKWLFGNNDSLTTIWCYNQQVHTCGVTAVNAVRVYVRMYTCTCSSSSLFRVWLPVYLDAVLAGVQSQVWYCECQYDVCMDVRTQHDRLWVKFVSEWYVSGGGEIVAEMLECGWLTGCWRCFCVDKIFNKLMEEVHTCGRPELWWRSVLSVLRL